jgi:hypothetical protein
VAVYIDTFGSPDQVFADFSSLIAGAGTLGEVNVPGYTDLYQLTYDAPGADAVCQRIKALVDHTANVVVSGVPSSFIVNGTSITQSAGVTMDGTTSAGEQVTRVIYDVGLCNGSGYWVDGQSGSHISLPRAILLYHELSHAWHAFNGTVSSDTAAEEQAAESDENVARSKFGEPLRLTTSHSGGCGAPSTSTGTWQIDCFIVTATTGSPSAPTVDAFRLVRDAALRTLPGGHQLFEDLYREYYTYSPRIARLLSQAPEHRDAYREAIVDPLLETYGVLLDALRAWPDVAAVDAVFTRAYDELSVAGPLPPDAPGAPYVDALRLGSPAADLLGAAMIGDPGLPLTDWAIIRPLRVYWKVRRRERLEPSTLRGWAIAWLAEQLPVSSTLDSAHSAVAGVATRLEEGSES